MARGRAEAGQEGLRKVVSFFSFSLWVTGVSEAVLALVIASGDCRISGGGCCFPADADAVKAASSCEERLLAAFCAAIVAIALVSDALRDGASTADAGAEELFDDGVVPLCSPETALRFGMPRDGCGSLG